MKYRDKLLREIDILKTRLERVIEMKENLLDPEVIHASRLLDAALNKLSIYEQQEIYDRRHCI